MLLFNTPLQVHRSILFRDTIPFSNDIFTKLFRLQEQTDWFRFDKMFTRVLDFVKGPIKAILIQYINS